jgi:hypothetical protein
MPYVSTLAAFQLVPFNSRANPFAHVTAWTIAHSTLAYPEWLTLVLVVHHRRFELVNTRARARLEVTVRLYSHVLSWLLLLCREEELLQAITDNDSTAAMTGDVEVMPGMQKAVQSKHKAQKAGERLKQLSVQIALVGMLANAGCALLLRCHLLVSQVA